MLAAITLPKCGGWLADQDPRRVVDESARGAATRLSQRLIPQGCPQAVRRGGRDLSQRPGECLRRARDAWLRELRRGDYNPGHVGRRAVRGAVV